MARARLISGPRRKLRGRIGKFDELIIAPQINAAA